MPADKLPNQPAEQPNPEERAPAREQTEERAIQAIGEPLQEVPEPKQAPAAPTPRKDAEPGDTGRGGGGALQGRAAGGVAQQFGKRLATLAAKRVATSAAVSAAAATAPVWVPIALVVAIIVGVVILVVLIFLIFAGVPSPQKGLSGHVDSDPKGGEVLALSARAGDSDAQTLLRTTQIEEKKNLLTRLKEGGECANQPAEGDACQPFPPEVQQKLNELFSQIAALLDEMSFLVRDTTSDLFLEKRTALNLLLGQVGIASGLAPPEFSPQEAYQALADAPNLLRYLDLQRDNGSPLAYPEPPGTFNALQGIADPVDGKRHRRNGYLFDAEPLAIVYANWDGEVVAVEQWNNETSAVTVRAPAGTYEAIYGHISPLVVEGTKVVRGDEIGMAVDRGAQSAVSLRVRSANGRWIDWAVEPWRIRSSVDQNDSAATILGGG